MANITRRITGRFGQIWLQNGATAVSLTGTRNSVAETVEGITYDINQVWTMAASGFAPPIDPSGAFTLTVGATIPAGITYTYDINYMLGKVIFTPGIGATTVAAVTGAPTMMPQGDTSSFSLDVKADYVDATSQMQTWKQPVQGFREWSGSATIYYRVTDWWLRSPGGSTTETASAIRFYPGKGIGTEYWYGFAFLSWGLKVDKGSMLEQSVSFTGLGSLIYAAS